MATVAAVYTVAPHVRTPERVVRSPAPWHEPAPPRPPVEDKRVSASLEHRPEAVLMEPFREGLRRDPERRKTWAGLLDGKDRHLWLLTALARKHDVKLAIVLGIIHVCEYLWSASLASLHDIDATTVDLVRGSARLQADAMLASILNRIGRRSAHG